ncbi:MULTISPECIES: DUF4232 domain-containing protein [Streptacidiphilus]|uniref:DUF4232 domain-containing protein n=1 Tax=Streptacidiphilus cavernicola TaxID=3342716 RepID=A0ABV6UH82_9ACTN|nr:DUF4232 domain-containing protein [Streptacidiphilus jeojiense]
MTALLSACAGAAGTPGSADAAGGFSAPDTSPLPTSGQYGVVSASPSVTATPVCPASGIRFETGEPDAAMGLRAVTIRLVDCGTRPYKLDGYPGIRVLDQDGSPLTVAVSHGSEAISRVDSFDRPAEPLTLQPGERAEFGLIWRNTVTDATVVAADGASVEITPAPGRPAQTFTPGYTIDLGNTGKIGVSAWHRAQGG